MICFLDNGFWRVLMFLFHERRGGCGPDSRAAFGQEHSFALSFHQLLLQVRYRLCAI